MKKFTKIMSLVLALVMMLSLAACGEKPSTDETTPATEPGNETVEYVYPYADLLDNYDELSSAIYADVLGEFQSTYEKAYEAETVSERYALMALAEAKLLESGVMLPTTTAGGNYAISRAVPYTSSSQMWGNDADRYHNLLVATELITVAHRDELKAMWAELKGTGTWEAEAKKFLEDNGYTLTDSYSMGYSSDPQTWDALATSMAADSEAIVNTFDGLVEYNSENVLSPALAESWEVSEDGLEWTFHIRQGVKWVDSQGREVADVTADDFVAGMQHVLEAGGGLEWLIDGVIVNAGEYYAGECTDFAEVGVKATDDYTLVYTLCEPITYFDTMLGYNVFAPMSRSFYESKGGKFGDEFDSSAESYTYGRTPDDIAYCGPYLVTNATAKNTIVFKANESYWNKDNINVKTLTWLFNDGSDPTKAYKDTVSGVLSGAGLNTNAVESAVADGLFDDYAYVSLTNGTSYMAWVNLHREALVNFNDGVTAASEKTEEEVARFNAAILNQHFRMALAYGMDRASYNEQSVGATLRLNSVRNSYTPGTFVFITEDVTVDINGTATTFPAGTYYGEIMQAQIDADGFKFQAWNPEADGGVGSSDGYDGWYNPENAAAEMALAVEELAALGLEISEENPIVVDFPYYSASQVMTNRAAVYKQSIEASLGGLVKVNLVDAIDSTNYNYATYYNTSGAEGNFDVNTNSGWGPDYGDPKTYLDTILPDYAGYMTKNIGIF